MSAHAGTALASTVQVLRRLLELHRLDTDALAAQAGIEPRPHGGRIDERTPLGRLDDLLRYALARLGDPSLGLRAARCWHPSYFGVLGHAWLVSATLRDGLRRVSDYYELIGERGTLEVEDVPGGVAVAFRSHRVQPASQAVVATIVDIVMSILVDMCRYNAGAGLRPLRVALHRPRPAAVEAYLRFFGCPVDFGAPHNVFVLSDDDARLPLPTSNRRLSGTFDRLLADDMALRRDDGVARRCRAAVAHQLPGGRVEIAAVAEALGMTVRMLQRRLADAGTGFVQIVDQTRRDIALEQVGGTRRPLGEIAFMLGFGEASSFTRAFRRWSGRSPSAHRADPGRTGGCAPP